MFNAILCESDVFVSEVITRHSNCAALKLMGKLQEALDLFESPFHILLALHQSATSSLMMILFLEDQIT